MFAKKVRTVRLRPYRPGLPYFDLDLFDPYESDLRGAPVVLWRLTQRQKGKPPVVIFDGTEEPQKWRCSGWFSVDGDEAVECCLKFASLQPGDTDREFFDDYTPEQLYFVRRYGEVLGLENHYRFQKDA